MTKPGVHLAPAGITLRELVDEYCGGMLPGHELYGYLPGGASGGILPASLADVPLDFDTLNQYGCFIGSAAIVVLSNHDTAAAAARNVMKFFSDESCGQCTPCRVGTVKALQLMGEKRWDAPLIQELSQAMMDASICGLGQAAPNPALTVLKYFPERSSVDPFQGCHGFLMLQKNPAVPLATSVSFTLNGQTVVGSSDETILQTADRLGVEIPRLCYMEGMRADGNCRTCMVEIKGERVLAPSCCRYPKDGMEVTSNNERALTSQKMSIELLLADMPETAYTRDSELDLWAKKLEIGKPRFKSRPQPVEDLSHPAMAVHLDACIQCKRCVRACREEQVNDVIGYAFRAGSSKIVFDLDDPMGDSTCVACGECVQACPTGALMPARDVGKIVPDKQVDSVCPYCGVGCQLTYNVKDNKIIYVQGKDGPANSSRLCVKGRYGFDYVHHKHRLTTPLIRKAGVPKHKDFVVDPDNWRDVFREATLGRSAGLLGRWPASTSATPTASVRSPASAPRRAPTKRRTCSRNSCAPASARTTSTTARASATPRAWRR